MGGGEGNFRNFLLFRDFPCIYKKTQLSFAGVPHMKARIIAGAIVVFSVAAAVVSGTGVHVVVGVLAVAGVPTVLHD
jgi:hypothetical protein